MLHWAQKYVGLPWKARGVDKLGLDCKGLVYMVYREEFGIELDVFANADYKMSKIGILETLKQNDYHKNWSEIDKPKEGDVIVLLTMGIPAHLGVVLDGGKMLHIQAGKTSNIESYRSLLWKNKIDGFYRHSER